MIEMKTIAIVYNLTSIIRLPSPLYYIFESRLLIFKLSFTPLLRLGCKNILESASPLAPSLQKGRSLLPPHLPLPRPNTRRSHPSGVALLVLDHPPPHWRALESQTSASFSP